MKPIYTAGCIWHIYLSRTIRLPCPAAPSPSTASYPEGRSCTALWSPLHFLFIYFTLPALFLFVGISKTIESGRAEHCVQVHIGLLPGSPYSSTPPLVLFLKLSESFDIVPFEPGYIHLFFLIFSI